MNVNIDQFFVMQRKYKTSCHYRKLGRSVKKDLRKHLFIHREVDLWTKLIKEEVKADNPRKVIGGDPPM